jgi:hypothetical protein
MNRRRHLVMGAGTVGAMAVILWVVLLGAARVRYHHDATFCRSGTVVAGRWVNVAVDQGCIGRREAARWGPYHLFGTNASAD